MEAAIPAFSAHAAAEEPWRLVRLARVDGRLRELMRVLTRETAHSSSSDGEVVWVRHVRRLHDDRGTLVAHVSAELAGSPWLAVVAATLARAWESEDESALVFRLPDGRELDLGEILPPVDGVVAPETVR